MRRLALLVLLAASCGDNVPPTVEEVRVSNPTSRRFQELFITLVGVEDPDGNVYAGKVKVKAEPVESGPTLKEDVRPFTASEPNRTKGDVIFGLTLSGAIPIGVWKIEVIFEDEAGATADPMYAEVTLTN